MSPIAIAFVVSVCSLFLMIGGLFYFEWGATTTRGLVYLALSGVMAGIGFLAYTRLVSNPEWAISTYAPASTILIVIILTLGGKFFYGEPLSSEKIIGLLLGASAVWLMVK